MHQVNELFSFFFSHSHQQFNQLTSQQQQQILNNTQSQNLVIINQSGGQQIIAASQPAQANAIQQQSQVISQQILQQQRINVSQQQQIVQGGQQQTFAQVQGQQILVHTQPNQLQPGQTQTFVQQNLQGQTSSNQSNQITAQQPQQRIQFLHTIQQPQQQQTIVQTQDQANLLTNQLNVQKIIPGQQVQHNLGTPQQILQAATPQQVQGGVQQANALPNQPLQKIHIQNQVVIAQQNIAVGQQPQQQGQLTPQSPIQGQQHNQQSPQQQGPPTFIRATRPQWAQGGKPGTQRQLIHLDAQTHAHLQTLDPIQRAEYLAKLQKRNILLRQQVAYQVRPGTPQGMVQGVRPGTAQHIVVRSQPPPGLNPQQQVAWLQQQRPILVRSSSVTNAAPGLSPISQTGTPTAGQTQFTVDPNAAGQFTRLQPHQPGQKPEGGDLTNIVLQQQQQPVGINHTIQQPQQQIVIQDGNNLPSAQMNKTKTALANMLSNRLSNNGGSASIVAETPVEPSAAGTLRLMGAQHNAALNQVPAERSQQELLVLQQQQLQSQQRRTLGNITNSSPVGAQPPTPGTNALSPGPMAQSPSNIKGPPFSPGRAPLPRPQFYGHNPNLKLPPELFLLGCIFYIVEYDETHEKVLPQWKQLIQRYGGEIENLYCPRVTHVLCRTQRHGVVMQAIRDSKRCVTAYWLNDTMVKKHVAPPTQALHLPMPSTFGTQRPATKYIIATSGFEGDERIRIKQMVEESGAMLTVYFSRHNSVLICKKPEGKKYKRAKDWNIPIVNTVWLSDILQGNLSHMSQYDLPKYQQYNLSGPFRIDSALLAHLMSEYFKDFKLLFVI